MKSKYLTLKSDAVVQRNVWFVCQGRAYVPGGGSRFLWAPQHGKTGRKRKQWDNVTLVRKGDLIFNYSNGLRAVSRATSDGYTSDNPGNANYVKDGYRVDVETFELESAIGYKQLRDKVKLFKQYLKGVDGPFDRDGKVKQGYLFRFTKEAGRLVKEIYGRDFSDLDIEGFFGSGGEEPIKEKVISFNHRYRRELCAIKTKPFIILAGISGTGKSRLVRTLAYKTCLLNVLRKGNRPGNFELIKVKPNWHDNSELVGYYSRINRPSYVVSSFLKFVVKAWKFPQIPFFVCLDEMNLAPVEHYFSEYLSLVETRQLRNGEIHSDAFLRVEDYGRKVYEGALLQMDVRRNSTLWYQFINYGLTLPANLVVIGTVNMDETTRTFSPKVLDRAMTIEMNHVDLSSVLGSVVKDWEYNGESITPLNVIGNALSVEDVIGHFKEARDVVAYLEKINKVLKSTSFEIAYRVANEFVVYCYHNSLMEDKSEYWIHQCLDEMTSMKILSRIEGDQARVGSVLDRLIVTVPESYEISQKKMKAMSERLKSSYHTDYWVR